MFKNAYGIGFWEEDEADDFQGAILSHGLRLFFAALLISYESLGINLVSITLAFRSFDRSSVYFSYLIGDEIWGKIMDLGKIRTQDF